MTTDDRPELREILSTDSERVGSFLSRHLNGRVSAEQWQALICPPWESVGPNRGFQLVDGADQVVGVYVAVYSTRHGRSQVVCNLAAFCVEDAYRGHSLRLIQAILRQRKMIFTDLSPSGNVPAMNERLGFVHLDVSTRLALTRPFGRRRDVTVDPDLLRSTLTGSDAVIYRDHSRAPAARHLLVRRGSEHAYLMFRRDRRRRLPLFATPLYAGGSPEVLRQAWPSVLAFLAARGYAAVLAETRVLGFTPSGPGFDVDSPRPRMYRPRQVDAESIDYLYSELTLVSW